MNRTISFLPFLSFAFFLLPFAASAQPAVPGALDWGNDYPEPSNTTVTKLVGIVPDGFYVLRQKVLQNATAKPRAWVEFFNKDMKLQRSEEVDLKYKGKQRDFEDVILLGNKLYLLTSFNNTAKKKNYLFRQEVSTKSLAPSKNLEMICETEARNKEVEGTFASHISKDSSKLLVYNELPYEKKQPERFGFRVYDDQFELLWAKDIVLPYPDNQFTVEEYRVDNKGNVYLLGVLYEDGAKYRRRGKPTYKYVVLAYTENGEKAQEYRVDLEDKFITDLTFRIADDGVLVCAGFYSEKGTYSIKGTYYFRLDPNTREVFSRNFKAFDFDFLTETMSEKDKIKAKAAEENNDRRRAPELYDYSLDELILRSDGGVVMVAEQFYIYQETTRDYPYAYSPYGYSPYRYYPYSSYRNYYQTTYWYNYNDIIVVNIRPTGEIEWSARIPKQQETRDDGGYYSSYAMSIVRDKLFFVFNDNARNYDPNRKPNRYYNFDGRESVIVLAEINKNGEVSTYPLAANRTAGVVTRPKICKQIGRREMAIYGEQGKNYRFAKLTFE